MTGANTHPQEERVFGNYQTTKLLGMSGGNSVYYAVNQKTQEQVALRALRIMGKDAQTNVQTCKDILAELKAIDAPHIVPILDYGFEEEVLYMTMPPLRGGSLLERLTRHREHPNEIEPPSLGEISTLITQLAQGLQALHDKDMIHGQIEMRNILFDEAGSANIADTGLIRLLKIIFRLDTTGSFTISAYTAPEQWEGSPLSPATDQYALACLAYELTVGKPPYSGKSIFDLMQAHMEDVVRAPHQVNKALPSDLAIPFWMAFAKPPENRHSSVTAFAESFASAIQGKEGESVGFFTQSLA
jgi:serine/threonine protein kinase